MMAFLSAEGFEVESFESAQEANIVIGSGGINMVIMGLVFADIEGEEFLKRTAESFAGPIIVISSSIDKKTEEKLLSLGARATISKTGPWKDELRALLSALK